MLGAVIFDFDGVVADSEFLHFKAFNVALKKYGVCISREKYYGDYLGYSDADLLPVLICDCGLDLSVEAGADLLAEKIAVFDRIVRDESSIFAGVAEFVGMLRDSGIRMAICSGALRGEITVMLDGSGFDDAFEVIVSADDVKMGKPDPEGFLKALSGLNSNSENRIRANECVVVEDSHWGLEAAGAAGMRRVAVTNTYDADQLLPYAERVVDRLDELSLDDLKRLCDAV